MPPSKNAQLRYLTLDRCLRNTGRRYFIEDLLEEVNRALYEFNGASSAIKRRQLFDDLNFMESESGFQASIERVRAGRKSFYRYADRDFSITNQPLNETESRQLHETILMLSRFKGLPPFGWIEEILLRLKQDFNLGELPKNVLTFDTNPHVEGLDFISSLFSATQYEKVLAIYYKPYSHKKVIKYNIHPYHLRQYNNRWFLFGYNPEFDDLTTLALDRIVDIEEIQGEFVPSKTDFEEYFEDIIGVTRPEQKCLQKIQLRFTPQQAPYVKTKPLHGSQKKVKEDENGLVIELELIPNYELRQKLLGFGASVEVLSPQKLRTEIESQLKEALKHYQADNKKNHP